MILKEIILISVIMLSIDFIYLYSVGNYFNQQVKIIQGSDLVMRKLGGFICYPFLVLGLYYFVIKNKKNYKSNMDLVRDATILGWVIYMVYESTNYAIFKKWKMETILLDGLWGGILFGLTAYIFLLIN
jgi:uncharacterized membrane protein|uniref:Uncharacterized protein n=1 Tax=Mimiviridae sp. ChoanoV1 TaxID=2596887 RepID=A0A5B8HYK4_9VIRU|nr:hypothetical protein 7_28 [Mimiviridae sp. ChoanoV1]